MRRGRIGREAAGEGGGGPILFALIVCLGVTAGVPYSIISTTNKITINNQDRATEEKGSNEAKHNGDKRRQTEIKWGQKGGKGTILSIKKGYMG